MYRGLALAVVGALVVQDPPDPVSEKSALHTDLATAAESVGDQLLKLKAWDEARAFLEMVRAKSDARGEALDKLIAKTEKQTSGLKWDAQPSELIKSFGADRAKKFFAYAKAWKEKDAEASRWTQAEGEILDDFLDYVKAYARLTQIRAHYELPKTRFDWKLSVPAVWHAKYKFNHPSDSREVEGKSGYTTEGEKVAKNSISSGFESISELMENVSHAPLYRSYVLHPRLVLIGIGQSSGTKHTSVIDVRTGLADTKGVPLVLCVPKRNAPNVPITGYDNYTAIFDEKTMRQLGYPVSVILYDQPIQPKEVSATMTLNMKEVDCYLSTPERPIGATISPSHRNTILLVAKVPLQPNAEYKVTIRWREKDETRNLDWSFRTAR